MSDPPRASRRSRLFANIHLIFGMAVLAVFLFTGQLMRADFPDKEAIEQELRLLMRSRHIYILFTALIHTSLGLYAALSETVWQCVLQIAGSVLLFAAGILLIWAFGEETYGLRHFSDLSRYGIYLSGAGILLHLIGGLPDILNFRRQRE